MNKTLFIIMAALLMLPAMQFACAFHGMRAFATIDYDDIPPKTSILIGEQKPPKDNGTIVIVSSEVPITLIATDNTGGSGVVSTTYRIFGNGYNSGWLTYSTPFKLVGLSDGQYYIAYNSTDQTGNVELSNMVPIIIARQVEVTPTPIISLVASVPTFVGMIVAAGALIGAAFIFIADAELIRRRRKRKAEANST